MSDPLRRLEPVVRLAPAKLNLTLAVGSGRADGYHPIHSVMVPLALADRLSLAALPSGDDALHVEGFDPGPPADNLVLRAIALARQAVRATGVPTPPLAARLDKRIPVAAGLGGGSSDAAAALDAALDAWGADLGLGERLRIAAALGSDVPFFVAARPALAEGRGEQLTPLRGLAGDDPGILLVTPGLTVSTADVFAAFDAGAAGAPAAASATRLTSSHLADELARGLRTSDFVARAGAFATANDLANAAAVVVPELVPFRRALVRLVGRPVGLSGSGPTLWAVYPSVGEAEAAAGTVVEASADGRLPVPGGTRPFVMATTAVMASRREATTRSA